ncbi:MAG: histone deacetylase family protein, partial [Candidatus Calescibacterium sp.]|nr:histone deacetylase family protein [Candidatus Calescibacterium sp.]
MDYIKNECVKGFHRIDSDTYVNEYTFDISTRFITATYMATLNSIEFGGLWLIMPRPGGHHAGRSGWAMGAPTLGFCIFNYAAIAAKTLLDRGFKVLMVDFDAHHGNGTQDIFWIEPRVIHIDIHEWGIYPGTGYVDDIGGGGAEGTKINIPLPHYAGDPEYIWIVENVIQPLIEVFKPNGIVVSAGFDSYVGDRLTTLSATDETYEAIAQIFIDAMKIGGVKTIITILEGGYGEGLKMGLTAYVETLIQIRK